jgi:hypothetical protein
VGKQILGLILTTVIAPVIAMQPLTVPFTLCASSESWRRPSAVEQSRIWSDERYKAPGPTSHEWTHNFVWNDPDSASITYHNENLSGLWTEGYANRCPRRDPGELWTEIWALNYHVTEIAIDGWVHTVRVEHRALGFEIVQFQRPASLGTPAAKLRFVTSDGAIVDEWNETTLSVFVPTSRRR